MNDFELNQNTNRLAAACTQSSPETRHPGVPVYVFPGSGRPWQAGSGSPASASRSAPASFLYAAGRNRNHRNLEAGRRHAQAADRGLGRFWRTQFKSLRSGGMPFQRIGPECDNRSVSEASRDLHLSAGVHEENGQINLHIVIHFSEPVSSGQLKIRFDFRPLPFYKVLQDTAAWWDTILPDPPMEVPDCARFPCIPPGIRITRK